jgi:hypothetical protein
VQVWLSLTPAQLARLTHDPPPGWRAILADLNQRITCRRAGVPDGDPRRRLAGVLLRRWLGLRDRRCTFPGCRIPVHRCDVDHVVGYAQGGPTVAANLGPVCRRDHGLHTAGGWQVAQPRPGCFVWTSPTGHRYVRTPPAAAHNALDPMPEPTHPDQDIITAHTYIGIHQDHNTCKDITPPPRQPQPKPDPPPPATNPIDEIPPF